MDAAALQGRKVAYFLVPLPEPIGLPVGFSFPYISYETFADFINRVESSVDRERQTPAITEFVSLIAHNLSVAGDDALVRNTSALVRLARNVLPWALSDGQKTNEGPPESTSTIRQDLTVVEIACLLPEDTDDDGIEAVVDAAFDAGIEKVRGLQRAYFLAYKYPMHLLSREYSPPLVPMAIARVSDTHLEAEQTLTMMGVNGSGFLTFYRDQEPIEDAEPLARSMVAIIDNVPFLAYLDSFREAMVARNRRGDYRGTVVFAASAAEALLDELLLHMLWEECAKPDVAAELFVYPSMAIQTRVKRDYESRLGGRWATKQSGPIRDWSRDIASVRHKAIHAGYDPSRQEADRCLSTLGRLEQFVTARLADPRRLRNYPRTALALMGETGLRHRGLWRGKIKAISTDDAEPDWAALYGRWRATVERIRLADQGMDTAPDVRNAILIAILDPTRPTAWAFWDRPAGMVVEASAPSLAGEDSGDPMAGYRSVLLEEGRLLAPVSASTPESWRDRAVKLGSWMHEYKLVPEAACMLDGSDRSLH